MSKLEEKDWVIMRELADAHHGKERMKEQIEYEKNHFAEMLGGGLGNEIKSVLNQKENFEKKSAKKSWFKKFIEKLVKVCQ